MDIEHDNLKSEPPSDTPSAPSAREAAPGHNANEAKTRIKKPPVALDQATLFAPTANAPLTPQNRIANPLTARNNDLTAIKITETAAPIKPRGHTAQLIDTRYELKDQLGEGGMGKVYKVIDRESSGDVFALKILSAEFKSHPDAVISLERECAKSRKLRHNNIVGVHHFAHARDTGEVYMLLEYLQGKPLKDHLIEYAGEGLPKAKAMKVLRGLCRGLAYAHASLLVHSDLKPGNIFVTTDDTTKILDFGLARALSDESNIFDPSSLKGLTPAYASLEIQRGELPAFSDDIYALGCVAYELFAGCHPYHRLSAQEAQAKGLKARRIKGLSNRQWNALKSTLSFTAEKRVDSVDLFARRFFGKSKVLLMAMVACAFAIPFGLWYLSTLSTQKEIAQIKIKNALLSEQEQQKSAIAAAEAMALKIKINDKDMEKIQENLKGLLAAPVGDDHWASALGENLNHYETLTKQRGKILAQQPGAALTQSADSSFETSVRQRASLALIALAKSQLQSTRASQKAIELAQSLLTKSQYWANSAKITLDSGAETRAFTTNKQAIAEQTIDLKELINTQQQALKAAKQSAVEAKIAQQLAWLQRSIVCNTRLDIKLKVSTQLNNLKLLSRRREAQQRPIVAKQLAACITALATGSLSRANRLHAEALQLLPEQPALTQLKVDRCAHLKPGSGARRSHFCRDRLSNGEKGPSLVVVPMTGGGRLAIAKYEITRNNIATYCKTVGLCKGQNNASWLPAHGLSMAEIQGYLDWLSRQSGYAYRLPTYNEWLLAASASTQESNAGRNCHLVYGAIIKGDTLNDANSGAPNKYGLFNTVGNVRELVYGANNTLLAVGASRKTAMNKCSSKARTMHTGQADSITGFRVVRSVST